MDTGLQPPQAGHYEECSEAVLGPEFDSNNGIQNWEMEKMWEEA